MGRRGGGGQGWEGRREESRAPHPPFGHLLPARGEKGLGAGWDPPPRRAGGGSAKRGGWGGGGGGGKVGRDAVRNHAPLIRPSGTFPPHAVRGVWAWGESPLPAVRGGGPRSGGEGLRS